MAYPHDDDGDALRRVARTGSDMSRPMPIDFAVAVPNENAARRMASLVQAHGYAPDVRFDEATFTWSCYCTRTMVPDYDAIVAAQEKLDALAATVGGHSDGWGTFGNASEPRGS